MEKTVVVINGPGGVGKDTLCDAVGEKYRVKNISSITPIKQIATMGGWQNEKSLAARKLLSDIKLAFVAYNDLPTQYCFEEYQRFMQSGDEILFVHIREGAEIQKLLDRVPTKKRTLLVDSNKLKAPAYGNTSDDLVFAFPYDYTYMNDLPLEEAKQDFLRFFDSIL